MLKFIKNKISSHHGFYSTLLTLTLPLAMQNFITASLNLIDNIMIGRLGETEIAAVGISNQIFFLFHLFLFGINSGAAIFTAQFWGQKNIKNIRKVLGICLITGIFISVVFMLLILIMPSGILSIFTKDPFVIKEGVSYLRFVAISYLFYAIAVAYSSILRSTGEVMLPLKINILAIGINTLFNYFLIYGSLGFPKMGVAGAALATTFARIVECVIIVGLIYRADLAPAANFRQMINYNTHFLSNFFKTITPVILNEFLWSLGITMYAIVYARMDKGIYAAINIASTIERIGFILFFGMAQGCSIMIGNIIGSGDEETAFNYAKKTVLIGPMLGIIISFLLLASRDLFLSFYQLSPNVSQLTKLILLVIACIIPIKIFNMILVLGVLRSGGDTKFSLFIDIAGIWLIGVPIAFIAGLVWKLPAHIVYIMAASEELFKFVVGSKRLLSKKWINNVTHRLQDLNSTLLPNVSNFE